MREVKSDRLELRLTPKDRQAIERAAKRAGMGISEYGRACILTMMVTQLDPHAIEELGKGIAVAAARLVSKLHGGRLVTS